MKEIKTSIFTLKSYPAEGTTIYRLECPEWVNVIPVTEDGQVVLVKQFRHGIEQETLEIPGGMMDQKDDAPMKTAMRELLEETGYEGTDWISLGWVHTNPAIINNRCHFFLARNVKKTSPIRNDPHEKTEVVLRPLADIQDMIRTGTIRHSLVVAAFHFYGFLEK